MLTESEARPYSESEPAFEAIPLHEVLHKSLDRSGDSAVQLDDVTLERRESALSAENEIALQLSSHDLSYH